MKQTKHCKPAKQTGTPKPNASKASGADQHAGDHTRTGVRDRIASLRTPGTVANHRHPDVLPPSAVTSATTLGGNIE